MKKLALFLGLLMSSAVLADAKLSLRQPCSNGMVLQQNSKVVIWGKADAGSPVSVAADWGAKARTKADDKGLWQLYINTPAAGYDPHQIQVKGDGQTIVLEDVLIGEVWMASGQSNMEIPMRGYHNCPIEGAAAYVASPVGRDCIRMYMETKSQSYEPVEEGSGRWLYADAADTWEMSATAFFFARQLNESLDIPIGIVALPYGGARVESWLPEEMLREWGSEDLSREHIESMLDYTRPYLAYNAMFNPLAGYTIKGFIWYQGCSNVGAHESFVPHMSALIRHWRERCAGGEAVPFYMVEIAPFEYGSADGESSAALLRAAQHQVAREVENCGCVVTNDLVAEYEKDNIHPARKKEIGERLAYFALNRQYGFASLPCESPRAIDAVYQDGQVVMHVENAHNGLNRMHGIQGLEVCLANGKWVPATDAFIRWEDGLLYVACKEKPTRIRYGWADFMPGNLYDCLGLPFEPFNFTLE